MDPFNENVQSNDESIEGVELASNNNYNLSNYSGEDLEDQKIE